MGLDKAFKADKYEKDMYNLWEEKGVFVADPKSNKEHFSISMPPPNETGTLSLGHALFLTLQDIMCRHARQQGKDVLWLPGTDHAALAVNAIIEKQLTEEGTTKHEIGREEFIVRTKKFVGNSRETMLGQMRAMGASADWTRLRYTLDEALNRCVNETFIKMYEQNLIYRGHRVVNWDPNLETNVSDDEVVYEEQQGKFYTFKYGPFEIGTARPETKFGDKYVVMHPDDKRYKNYNHGQTLEVEWINGKILATVIKDESVDPEFGTGVMTITPWHSLVDFDIAERHNLDKEQIIDFHGKLLPIAGEFAGLDIADARPKIVEKLKSKGLLVNIDENYVHNIAINERGKGIIEPQIRLQWFVDVNKKVVDWKGSKVSFKTILQSVIRDGDITLLPTRFEKTYFSWVDNLRDWCISRQIWWGHRIPVWYRHDTDGKEEIYVGITAPTDHSEGWNEWEQDPDTLDTWFSSALWTWSTLIDPELAKNYDLTLNELLKNSPDFLAYHPTSVMETGWDIIFFWVARMILSTTFVTGQVPFKNIYLHGLIKAEDGRKMSKSRPESIIDPLDVIPKYGTDALRMALIMGVTPGNDQSWSWSKIDANQKFANKIWNIARYIEGVVGDNVNRDNIYPKTMSDHWILSRLNDSQTLINRHLDEFKFSEAYDCLYHFIWNELADWYIEVSKTDPNKELLAYLLESVLTLMHPFAPFVTEAIWQELGWDDTVLASKTFSPIIDFDQTKAEEFDLIKDLISEVRYLVKALKAPKADLEYVDSPIINSNLDIIKRLTRVSNLSVNSASKGLRLVNNKLDCYLVVDNDLMKEYSLSLDNKFKQQQTVVEQLKSRLSNKNYIEKAPDQLVEETKQQLATAELTLGIIEQDKKRLI